MNKDNKDLKIYNTKHYETPDGYTTAERSLINAKNIDILNDEITQIGELANAQNLVFADGSVVSTQSTRAEDVVSNQDEALRLLIEDRPTTSYVNEQINILSTNIDGKANQSDLNITNTVLSTKANQSDLLNLTNNFTTLSNEVDNITIDLTDTISRVDNIEQKNLQQDGRLNILEEEISSVGVDYSFLNATGIINTEEGIIKPTIQKDYNSNIAINNLNENSELITTINNDGTMNIDYSFIAQFENGNNINLTIEVYENISNELLASKTHSIDFNIEDTYKSGLQKIYFDVSSNDEIVIKVKTDTGSVNINNSEIYMQIQTSSGGVASIYDYSVKSTADLGNSSTLEDINELNNQIKQSNTVIATKANQSDLLALTEKVNDIYQQVEEE